MASLNTLRTKFGTLLSVIIAGALLAFILSLRNEMGFGGNDFKVGEINGQKVKYSEFYDEYETIKARTGGQESTEEQLAQLTGMTWQSLFNKHVVEPGFDAMGITVGDKERQSMVNGEIPTQAFYSQFADPRTGAYNAEAVRQFLSEAAKLGNTAEGLRAQKMWADMNEQAQLERKFQKFMGLVRGGAYVNSLDVNSGVAAANETYNGRVVVKKYADLADSLFTVSNSEIRSYYKAHKAAYKQLPSRSISYVLFEVEPTEADEQATAEEVAALGEQFVAAEDVRNFVRTNHGEVAQNYASAAQLSEDEAEALLNGKPYGPAFKNNEWKMARVVNTLTAPDSLSLRQIVLPATATELADSLYEALSKGGDFAAAAVQYAANEQLAAVGGDLGSMPFASIPEPFASKLASARSGQVVKVEAGQIISLMQPYKVGRPTKHVLVASIVTPLEASDATRTAVMNEAATFHQNAAGSADAFNEAATAAAATPRVAKVMQGERTIRAVEDSREVVRWMQEAKVGDLSSVLKVGDDYLVARLTEVDKDEYTPVGKVASQIRRELIRDKKYEALLKEVKGATIEEVAANLSTEVAEFNGVSYMSVFFETAGVPEPALAGAIVATKEQGTLSAPVKGDAGLYLYVVDGVTEKETPRTAEDERVRAQAFAESRLQQFAMQAVNEMANMKDLSTRYF